MKKKTPQAIVAVFLLLFFYSCGLSSLWIFIKVNFNLHYMYLKMGYSKLLDQINMRLWYSCLILNLHSGSTLLLDIMSWRIFIMRKHKSSALNLKSTMPTDDFQLSIFMNIKLKGLYLEKNYLLLWHFPLLEDNFFGQI